MMVFFIRYWSIRLQTHAELHEWLDLEKMSKTKKIPGGFEVLISINWLEMKFVSLLFKFCVVLFQGICGCLFTIW